MKKFIEICNLQLVICNLDIRIANYDLLVILCEKFNQLVSIKKSLIPRG